MPHGSAAEQHARWRAYFNATSAALGGAEVCDCHRRGCCGWDLLTENRATRLDGGGVLSFATQLGSSSDGWYSPVPQSPHSRFDVVVGGTVW